MELLECMPVVIFLFISFNLFCSSHFCIAFCLTISDFAKNSESYSVAKFNAAV